MASTPTSITGHIAHLGFSPLLFEISKAKVIEWLLCPRDRGLARPSCRVLRLKPGYLKGSLGNEERNHG